MTVVINRGGDGPKTHALVMGVGRYPHLKNGATPRPDTMRLDQLTSPPVSALRIAEWLKTEYCNARAPLGTLNLLVSDPAGPVAFADDSGVPVAVQAAEMASAVQAVKDWKDKADESLENVTFFFFCGHGVSAGIYNGLLMENFGADHKNHALLENVIDIDNLHLAMDGVRARKQVYFIDACRSTPSAVSRRARPGGLGNPILDPEIEQGLYGDRDAPMFFACAANKGAHGIINGLSLFTGALIETLNGAGAVDLGSGWSVATDAIHRALNETMRWQASFHKVPGQRAEPRYGGGFNLHDLATPPQVQVAIGCVPEAANEAATFSMKRFSEGLTRPSGSRDRWMLRREPGAYVIGAEFEDGEPYQFCQIDQGLVGPPFVEFSLRVKQ